MRDVADFISALIFRSTAILKSEARLRSKNRRQRNFSLIGTQKPLLTLAFKISLIVLYKGSVTRPLGLL